MGKKGKKTRWRELPITLADKPYAALEHHSSRHATDQKPANFAAVAGRRSHYTQHQQYQSPNRNHSTTSDQQHHKVESTTVTFNEDEYTKITTPRQDVLFKKGYLGRRKHTSVPVINEVLNENEDGVPIHTIVNPLDEMCPTGEFVDPSAMYIFNGGGYEVYDPYTGNITVLMGPPPGHYPPVGHPMLATMSYQQMPLQAVDWYNPSNFPTNEPWMSGSVYQPNRHYKKQTADVQQNYNTQTSEVQDSVQEPIVEQHQALYQQPEPYMYPGYVYGAPYYDYNGVIPVPPIQSPPSPSISCDYINGKRRKKKKLRKRGGATDEYSDSSSEEQKSQSGSSSDHVLDLEKPYDSGVLTNNSGDSTPVNVIPVQLSHSAPPFHMECPQPFEIIHGTPIMVHRHPDQMAYYQSMPQYTEQLDPIDYQVIPEEQAAEVPVNQPEVEPRAVYSAETSDSGISSPNSEVMVKESTENKHEKPQATNGNSGQTTAKKSRNKKIKQRDKTAETVAKAKNKELPKNHHEGSKKSSKIAKEPAIIKKLNAKKAKAKPEPAKSETAKPPKNDKSEHEVENISKDLIELSLDPETEDWVQEEVFCSLECTPRSTTDNIQFQFTKSQSLDSCESVEEETFATAVNTGNSDTENEIKQDETGKLDSVSSNVTPPGPITEAVTKWLNDQGGIVLTPRLDDSDIDSDNDSESEYDDFEENSNTASPKNVQGNPYPALSRNEGSRVAGAASHDQRKTGLMSSGMCCLTQ